METLGKSTLKSPIFIIIGPDGKRSSVHSALLVQHSKVLAAVVHGGMKEAIEKVIHIEDIDGDIDGATIVRFVQYLYTGSYFAPHPYSPSDMAQPSATTAERSSDPSSSQSVAENMPEVVPRDKNNAVISAPDSTRNDSSDAGTDSRDESSKTELPIVGKDTDAWDVIRRAPMTFNIEFTALSETVGVRIRECCLWMRFSAGPQSSMITSTSQALVSNWRVNTSTIDDLRDKVTKHRDADVADFVVHAQMYVFSVRYDCQKLAELALQRLHLTLYRHSTSGNVRPIAQLTAYVYAHTYDYENGCDRLRRMILDFIICNTRKFMKDPEMRKLMKTNGAFAADMLEETLALLV